jgi:hypothetical protein
MVNVGMGVQGYKPERNNPWEQLYWIWLAKTVAVNERSNHAMNSTKYALARRAHENKGYYGYFF